MQETLIKTHLEPTKIAPDTYLIHDHSGEGHAPVLVPLNPMVISPDDVDHAGNVNALMEFAPNATLVVNWFLQERMGGTLEVSPLRQRWIVDGESLDVGDRTRLAVRPPVYDSPTTRGLLDMV